MKSVRASALLFMLLAPGATLAHAAGVNLSWDACAGENGIQNKVFACDTNTGTQTLYGSFVLGSGLPNAIGFEARVDITAKADSLPAWWRFTGPNTCRLALSSSFSFASDPQSDCVDPFDSQATGAVAGYHTFWTTPQVPGSGPETARGLLIAAVPQGLAQALSAGTEYYAFKMTISAINTVGTGGCSGCSTPVCITLSEVRVVGSDNTTPVLTSPVEVSTVTWQSADQCPGGLASEGISWGRIRSVLR